MYLVFWTSTFLMMFTTSYKNIAFSSYINVCITVLNKMAERSKKESEQKDAREPLKLNRGIDAQIHFPGDLTYVFRLEM